MSDTRKLNVRTLLGILLGYEGDAEVRSRVLGNVVLDLLMEVEAFRRTVIALSAKVGDVSDGEDALAGSRHGLIGPRSVYADAYADTAWLTHWSAGPSSGFEKLLSEFYFDGKPRDSLRECIMLKRLGFTDAEIQKYVERARDAETCT